MLPEPRQLALAGISFTIVYIVYRWIRHRMYFRKLPGPPHSFLFGHIRIMVEVASTMPPLMHPQAYYTEIGRKYNLEGIFYIDLWPVAPSSVVLTDPDLLDQVCITRPLRQHRLAEKASATIIGPNSIVTANGAMWKKLHHAMAPAFAWSHIRNLTGMIVDECLLFREALFRHADSGKAFSMEETAGKLIFDVVARAVFAFSLNAQTTGSVYLDDLKEMITLAEGQFQDPAVVYNPLARYRIWRRRREILDRLHPSMIEKIYERLDRMRSRKTVPSRKDPNCVLDLMLTEHVQDADGNIKSGHIPSADIQLLLTNIKGALIGGNGTTNDSICFLLMLLSKEPQVVEKMRQEHIAVFGQGFEKTKETLLTSPEKLQELPYTDAVMKESMRMFPVGFGLREADRHAVIKYQGREYPIGDGLAVALNGQDLHYNPRFFPEPTAFRPDRWLKENEAKIAPSYFRTFSRGQRACLGKNLATNEMKIILLLTLRDFEFRCAGLKPNKRPRTVHTDLDMVFGDIIFQELGMEAKPRGGMMMTVKRADKVKGKNSVHP